VTASKAGSAHFTAKPSPPRLNKPKSIEDCEDALRKRPADEPFDWFSRDGEIHGKRTSDTVSPIAVGSQLAYFRPLRAGETLSYEFFCKPGEVMVYPSLGRLAFLLEPGRVRLHWLTDNGGNDWTGLAPDVAVDLAGGPLPLKANDWNKLRLTLTEDALKVELSVAAACEGKLAPGDDCNFGLLYYKVCI
jgi:hypothetical protein